MRKLRELTTRYSLADLVEVLSLAHKEDKIGDEEIVDGATSPEARPEGEREFVKLHKTSKAPIRTGTRPDVFNASNIKKDTSRAGRDPLPGFPPDKWEVKEDSYALQKGENPWKVWKQTRGETGQSWGDFKSAQSKQTIGAKSSRRLQIGHEINLPGGGSPKAQEFKKTEAPTSAPVQKPDTQGQAGAPQPSQSPKAPQWSPTAKPFNMTPVTPSMKAKEIQSPVPKASMSPIPGKTPEPPAMARVKAVTDRATPAAATGSASVGTQATGQAAPTPSGPSASSSVNLTGAAKVAGAVGRAMTGQGLSVGQEIGKNFPSVTSAISGAARSLVPGQGVSVGMKLGQKFRNWLGKEETEQLMEHRAAILGSLIRGLEPELDEAAGVAKLVSKKVDPLIKRPKFDARGNLVLTQKAKQNITQGKKSRKLTGKTYDPAKQKRFGEAKEIDEQDETKPVPVVPIIQKKLPSFNSKNLARASTGEVIGDRTDRIKYEETEIDEAHPYYSKKSRPPSMREPASPIGERPKIKPKSAKERYASARRRKEMSRKHPELSEDQLDEKNWFHSVGASTPNDEKKKKAPTVLVSPKGYKGGGKVKRIPKSQYDPKKHSLAEQEDDATAASRGLKRDTSRGMGALAQRPSPERPPGGLGATPQVSRPIPKKPDPSKLQLMGEDDLNEKNWIQNAIKKPGALTAAAHRAHKSVGEFAREHKHSGGKVGKRARLALTLKGLNKEEAEQIDELKKATLVSYIKGAKDKLSHTAWQTGEAYAQGRRGAMKDWSKSSEKSEKGIERAADRLGGTYETGKPRKFMVPGDESGKVYSAKKKKIYHGEETQLDEEADIRRAPRKLAAQEWRIGCMAEFDEKKPVWILEEDKELDESGPTRKHFQLAADTIKAIPNEDERKKHAYHHAELFSKSNPRFNREKFYLAAGLKKHQYGPTKPHQFHGPQEETQLDEVITKSTPVKDVIHDFVHSDNKVFKGDSKKQRIKRALGAYYGKQRGE